MKHKIWLDNSQFTMFNSCLPARFAGSLQRGEQTGIYKFYILHF